MDKVTEQCPQTHNLSEEKEEPKRYRTEVLPLTSLTPYREAKPAHERRCYRTGKCTVCRHVRAAFIPEILQAGAVKRLSRA